MYEITADNALSFCREKGWIAPGPARVEAFGGGVSNIVLRVTTREGAFVLKQSRPQLRTRDAWFSDHRVFVQLRVDPFYRKVQQRRPEVAKAVGEVIERMLACREAICHGDYTPKNLLLHADGFTLVDYECAHYGDPTMDLGLFLA